MAAPQSILEILIQAVDESAAALEGATNNLKAVGQEAISTGLQIGVAGAAITAAYGSVVGAAANVQESQDSLKQAVVDAMASAGDQTASYATEVAFLEDKINGYKASIQSATAILDTNTGSAQKSAAAHARAAATIATAQINIQKYQQQLDILTNAQNLQGQSLDEITGKLESSADANVSLGFAIADSTHSLSQAFTATKSVSEALQVNQAAMDLARAKNMDLATATNQVILAMNGQGRALASYGIVIKDGLSGMEALSAVQAAVNGQAQAYAGTLTGQLAVAMQTFNKFLADMGNTQLPVLGQLLGFLVKIISAVDDFTQKHQKLTEVILLSVGIIGALLTAVGSLLVIFGSLVLIVGLITVPIAALTLALVVLAATIIANWSKIKDNLEEIMHSISLYIAGELSFIQTTWNTVWTAVSTFFVQIWDGIRNAFQSSIGYVQGTVQSFVSWAQGVLGPILGSINAVGSAASAFGKTVTGAVSSVLNIHDAIITPGGEVIQSDPADFLIATKTPGSLGGGSSIQIFIQGGNYLDSQGAKMIGDALARQIVQQIKTRNYAV